MGRIVIAAFKPKPGLDEELKHVIADRLPLLRRLGLATDRVNITMQSANGTILDVSEWVDDAAIERAHEAPEVLELWQRFDDCCDYVKLESLEEIHQEFPGFESVDL